MTILKVIIILFDIYWCKISIDNMPNMRLLRIVLTWICLCVLLTACGMVRSQPDNRSQNEPIPTIATTHSTATVLASVAGCSNPLSVIKDFYDSNDTGNFTASIEFFTPQATLITWAEGLNGRHWHEVHLTGREQILPALNQRGLRRDSGKPDSPIYYETEFKVSGDQVTFMLRPDRLSSNGKPYDPYKVIVLFAGCKIQSIVVIEYFTQV